MTGRKTDIDKINRYYHGHYSPEDEAYVNEVFREDAFQEELKYLLLSQWNDLKKENVFPEKNLNHVLNKIHHNVNVNRSIREQGKIFQLQKWFYRIAAILVIPLAIYFGNQKFKTSVALKNSWAEINAPAWSRIQFTLPDGTSGWLNSNSQLRYNLYNTRKVQLSGEAYFEVNKNESKTFIVTTDNIEVLVLGTRFNIAAYENENVTEVVLAEGKVLFQERISGKSYEMSPNHLISYDKTNSTYRVYKIQPDKYLSWTEGKLVFRNDAISSIARRLERVYNVQVEVINHPSFDDLRLRATFINENLDEVLKLLKMSLPVNYRVEKRELSSDGTYNKEKVIIYYSESQ